MNKWKQVYAEVLKLDTASVHVGVLSAKGGDRVHKSDAEDAPEMTIVELAALHEFGSPINRIPQRSFITSTLKFHAKEDIRKLTAAMAKGVVAGKYNVRQALGLLGQLCVSQIKTTIRDKKTMSFKGEPQANAPITIARKGSSTPLVDTGQLINSITYEIEDK